MNGSAVMNAYNKKQQQMTNKHLNKQWEHPDKTIKSREEFYSAMSKKKKTEDIEAILAIEDELWNS
jgi:uncharacterized short protein YbdD (DUF466 family)